jgi:cell division protein FtsB
MKMKILELVLTKIILPILKDLIFMIANFYRVREIRKKIEEENKKKVDDFKNAQTDQEIEDSFRNLP